MEELTPEALTLLKSLINRPHPVEDGPLLQLLLADRLVMGGPSKVHLTGSGKRLLAMHASAAE
ncbi:MAG: hypothetical protein KJ944_17865 [Alphaproteobacteria bacterium]|nr:hypothetical protein [Alphaproteobacteria bacterium]MBU1561948.1 hypothetical protein [Alphaproteobacteria bacterium]MBU2304459.1 hypothetical protein [Alphaproteobacteria bacterium]MBU2367680.1 hypothetical protein [Alphaproteobacteria bacterium]